MTFYDFLHINDNYFSELKVQSKLNTIIPNANIILLDNIPFSKLLKCISDAKKVKGYNIILIGSYNIRLSSQKTAKQIFKLKEYFV